MLFNFLSRNTYSHKAFKVNLSRISSQRLASAECPLLMPKITPLNAQDYSYHNAQQLQQRPSQDPFGVAGMDGGMGEDDEDDEDNGAYAEMGKRENLVGSTSKKALHFFLNILFYNYEL